MQRRLDEMQRQLERMQQSLRQQMLWQQMERSHQQSMMQLHQSAWAHQLRMDALHAASNARLQSWRAQQADRDAAHRRFLDTLTESRRRDGRRCDP